MNKLFEKVYRLTEARPMFKTKGGAIYDPDPNEKEFNIDDKPYHDMTTERQKKNGTIQFVCEDGRTYKLTQAAWERGEWPKPSTRVIKDEDGKTVWDLRRASINPDREKEKWNGALMGTIENATRQEALFMALNYIYR